MDCIPPKVKLSDDTFVFLDGKWVNESFVQPAISSSAEAHKKHYSKKMHSDLTLWEENKALWEENKALRVENRALREENKVLQCLRTQNKGIQVIYDESLQQMLQQENKPLVALSRKGGLQGGKENKALQFIQEEKKALQIFRDKILALKVFPEEEKKLTPVLQKEKQSDLLLGKEPLEQETNNTSASAEPATAEPETQEDSSATSEKERQQTALSLLEENEVLETVQKLNQMVLFLIKENHTLLEDKQALQNNEGGNKILWEENNKLKLQQKTTKDAISNIIAQMGLLQETLNAFDLIESQSENTE
ncbi:protein chibby homolog 2 [Anolis sagrei]|uniref:protein chibby homolog 2 n=1 Tax=Anolis sagrei TaxID=38937 RepID=UPI003521D240